MSRTIDITLKYFLRIKVEQEQIDLWAQQASFIFVGILVFTNLRSFLLFVTRLFHSWSSHVTSNAVIIFLGEIMGMYFVSSVLMMRMNLPLQYRIVVTQVLGDIEFTFYHAWFDVIFFISAVGTILLLLISKYIKTDVYIEEDLKHN